MTHILVVNGNPDPAPERLTHALATAYQAGAESAGHQVRRLDIGTMGVPFLQAVADFQTEPEQADVLATRETLLWAHHLVFVFPLWLGGAPAQLKALMEQAARAQFLLGAGGRGFPKGKLKGRTARLIVTMGMPPAFYRLIFRAHGVKAFAHGILGIAGIRPIRTSLFGGANLQPDRAGRVIDKVRRMGRRVA